MGERSIRELKEMLEEEGETSEISRDDILREIERVTKKLTTRSAASGLTPIQTRMIELILKGLDEEEIVGACKMKFDVSMKIIRDQYDQLDQGNYPRTEFPVLEALPHALVNGPFPVDPKYVADALTQKINYGRFNFELPEPYCKGQYFVRCLDGWKRDSEDDVLKWDPEFEEGEFSPDAYLSFWLDKALDVYVDKRVKIADKRNYANLKRKLIRTICTSQVENDRLLFVGEGSAEKRARIRTEYGGRMELLDTPIGEFSLDVVFEDDVKVPESARDLLLEEMNKLLA